MSRQDIADYLGLTMELSGTLSNLQNSAAIAPPSSRHIVRRNAVRLRSTMWRELGSAIAALF